MANWKGVIGVQFRDRNFSALGEEDMVPVTKSQFGGRVPGRGAKLEPMAAGARRAGGVCCAGSQNDLNPLTLIWTLQHIRGHLVEIHGRLRVGLDSHSRPTRAIDRGTVHKRRAPWHGHIPDWRYQFTSETTNNIDLALRKTTGAVNWKVNAFHNWINNYIFVRSADVNGDGVADRADDTGALDPNGEFLMQNFAQSGARFYGAEAEAIFTLKPDEIDLRLFADYVRGKLDSGGNVPRLTPWRFGVEFNHQTGPWTSNISATRVTRQNHVAELESSTPGYTLVNVEVTYRIKQTQSNGIKIFLQGQNLAQ